MHSIIRIGAALLLTLAAGAAQAQSVQGVWLGTAWLVTRKVVERLVRETREAFAQASLYR